MAGHAPGYDQAAEDLQCYNCGMKGHMFFACPEDTRRLPAGLEASRKRQASSNDYPASIKRNKGPVVTHYPPPPLPPPPPPGLSHIPPPPAAYTPRPGYEGFHSAPPPGPPPGPPYQPPPHLGQYDQYPPHPGRGEPGGFPYASTRDASYEHYFQGPPRAPPPETPYRQPHYDQYDRHISGPPFGAHYSRPYSAPPDRYDGHPADFPQAPPYTTAYRNYQAHPEHYPPTPGTNKYYSRPPQPYPPPDLNTYQSSSHYRYDVASPARSYTPGHGSPPSGSSSYPFYQYPPSDPPPYHARFDDRFSDRPSYEEHRRESHPQHSATHTGEKRQNHDRHDRRSRYGSPKHRSRSERRFPDRPPRLPSPVNSIPPTRSVKDLAAPAGSKPQKGFSNVAATNSNIADELTVEDLDWEDKMIFKELPVKVTKDLIREPLPAEWTDDPIMPPKYDKETITSRYITPTNIDDFALSIRETKAWQAMQYHPAFLPITDICIEKIQEYERALNPGPAHNKQNLHGTSCGSSNRQRGKSWGSRARGARQHRYSQNHAQNYPSSDDPFNSFWPGPRRNSWDQDSYRDVEELRAEGEAYGREPRLSSPEPGELCENDDRGHVPTTRVTSPSWEQDNYYVRQNRRDPVASALKDARVGPLDVVSDSDARQSSLQTTPTPLPTSHLSGSLSRPPSRRSSRVSPSRPSSRLSVKSNVSRESSRCSSVASPLTPNERELLGMRPYSSGSDSGRDSPAPQVNGVSARSRQRPAKLHAAYQRRW